MRLPSRHTVVTVLATAIVAVGVTVPVTLAVSDNPVPTAASSSAPTGDCPSNSPSETGTHARSYRHGLASWVLPLDTARQIMHNDKLDFVDTDNPTTCVYTVVYRDPAITALVSVQVYRETDAGIKAAFNEVTQTFKHHAGERYYRNAEAKYWPTGPTHAMPSATYAYTVHTPKYGHNLIYANNGTFTVRIRVGMYNDNGALPVGNDIKFALAEAALKNAKQFQ